MNAVAPGPISTDLTRGVPPEKLQALTKRLAIQQMSTVADVWNVVEFFIKKESAGVTGQVVYLGGV